MDNKFRRKKTTRTK